MPTKTTDGQSLRPVEGPPGTIVRTGDGGLMKKVGNGWITIAEDGTPLTDTKGNPVAPTDPAQATTGGAVPGYLGNTTHKSDEQVRLEGELSQIDAEIARLTQIQNDPAAVAAAGYDPNLFTPEVIAQHLQVLTTARENDKTALTRETQKQAAQVNPDATFASDKMLQAEGRAAPTISPTTIQTTKADFSAANNTLAGSDFIRDRQLSQADRLQSGVGGADQADLAARLKASSGGEGQAAHISRLESDLAGNQPSLAQLTLEEGRDASINNAMSIANSARGNTMGMSQIEALRSNQAAMQQARREAAMLRASEYATARGELGTTLGQKRAQDQAGWSLEGTTLSQKRGQDLQGENIAATEYGQGRQQDLATAGIQAQNALSQAQMDQATRLAQASMDDNTKRANLAAYFQQQGMNAQQAQYWTDKYIHFKERPEDIARDQKNIEAGFGQHVTDMRQQQDNIDTARSDKQLASLLQGAATWGTSLSTAAKAPGATGVEPAPGTPQTAPKNDYSNPYSVVDPWDKDGNPV